MRTDWRELTRQHRTLAIIPGELAALARRRKFQRGEQLFRMGAEPRDMLFLLRGEVRLTRLSPDGGELLLQRVRHGFIAEASLYARNYHCGAVAAGDGESIAFPRGAFRTALDAEPFRTRWLSLLSDEIRTLRARCERLALNGTAARILHYLRSEGVDGVVHLSHSRKSWAAELGVSHESLYRTLASLRRSGRIRIDGNRIALIPVEAGQRTL